MRDGKLVETHIPINRNGEAKNEEYEYYFDGDFLIVVSITSSTDFSLLGVKFTEKNVKPLRLRICNDVKPNQRMEANGVEGKRFYKRISF